MARVTNNGITGLVGKVVFYQSNGKNLMRTNGRMRPSKKKAFLGSRHQLFGNASRYAVSILKVMQYDLRFRFRLATFNNLRGWIISKYTDGPIQMRLYSMSQLNPAADLRDHLDFELKLEDMGGGQLKIHIPAINPVSAIKAPPQTKKITIRFVTVSRSFEARLASWMKNSVTHSFDHSDNLVPEKDIIIDTNAAAGQVTTLAMALEFEDVAGMINKDEKWLPAAVVAMGSLRQV